MSNYKYTNIEFKNESVKKWWKPEIDKKKLKELHEKRNLPAILNTILYFFILIFFGIQYLRS